MPRIITAALAGLLATVFSASALDFNSEAPGSFASSVTEPATVTDLRISGPVDASDLCFIGRTMTALTRLDLSAASIASYSGEAINGLGNYDANTIPTGAFAGTAISEITLPATPGLRIGDAAFAGSAIKELSIPSTVAFIGQGSFSGCKTLEKLTLCGSYTSSGYAFSQCASLNSIDIKAPVAIADADFSGCTLLEKTSGFEMVTAIGADAFAGCKALESVTWGEELTTIGDRAFFGSGIKSVEATKSDKLTEIGEWAFSGCSNLLRVELPDATASIGRGAFFGCEKLTTLILPSRCTAIADFMFNGDRLLDSDAVMHDCIETIGAYAFKDNTRKSQMHIPASLTYMANGAMEGMTSLRRIYAKGVSTVAELGDEVWRGLDPAQIFLYVDEAMADAFREAPQWREFNISTSSHTGTESEAFGKVSAHFSGRILTVRSTGNTMDAVSLYSIDGLRIATAETTDNEATVDTSHRDDHIFIVDVRMTDGSRRVFKLARP